MNAIYKNLHIKKLINKLTFKLICKIEWGKQVRTEFKKRWPAVSSLVIRASDLFKIPRPTELKKAQLSKLN